jgi:hypothetical protein
LIEFDGGSKEGFDKRFKVGLKDGTSDGIIDGSADVSLSSLGVEL